MKSAPNASVHLLTENTWQKNFSVKNDIYGKNAKWSEFDGEGCLRVDIPKNQHYGVSAEYKFTRKWTNEPEELYLSYEIMFLNNWNPKYGGKLPGFSGTYGIAGWGGRPSDGTNGWSARLGFRPLNNKTVIGYYVYHAEMEGNTGDDWYFKEENVNVLLSKNQWYKLRLQIKLNSIGNKDGRLEAWIDDHKVFQKRDIVFRKTDRLKIESIWLNVYMGGKQTDDIDNSLLLKNMTVIK